MRTLVKVGLPVSLAINVALGAALFVGYRRHAQRVAAARGLCGSVEGNLSFLIDGLERGNDPFYTPLAVQQLESTVVFCRPGLKDHLASVMPTLRQHLIYLVAANTTDEQKRRAHDEALAILRELRARFAGRGT
jgi:hypothetical protein